jgi:hypothetical protein
MPIDRLSVNANLSDFLYKINELVDKINALELVADKHYHKTLDSYNQVSYETGYNSSFPRLDE